MNTQKNVKDRRSGSKAEMIKMQTKSGMISKLNNIRTKLTISFFIPVIFIIMLGAVSYYKSSNGMVELSEKSTLSTLIYMSQYVDFGMSSASEKMDILASSNMIKNYYSGLYQADNQQEQERYKELVSSVAGELVKTEFVSNIYIFSNYGKGFSGNAINSAKLSFEDYTANGEGSLLKESKDGAVWIGSHPYIDNLSGENNGTYAISYMQYIYNIVNKPIGCIIIDISYDFIYKTLSEVKFPTGSVVAFITSDGKEIISGTVLGGYEFQDQDFYQLIMADENSKSGNMYVDIAGKYHLLTYSKLTNGSLLISVVPKNVIIANVNDVRNITLLVVIFTCVIAISLGAYIAYGFSNTIAKVNNVLQKTEEGDLTSYTSIKRKDEFQILGKCINDVIVSMSKLIRNMTGASGTVAKSAAIVSESSIYLVNASQDISNAVNDIEKGIIQQAEDAESCLQQMADLSEKINDLNTNTQDIARIAGSTKLIASKGMGIVDNLSSKTKDTTQVTRTVINDIENLEEQSRAITEIIETMNGITEQTNLLSLNASIEAARAGECGNGFSVVAQEIRKLADQSSKFSNKIADIVSSIEQQTKITVNSAKYAESIALSQEEALISTIHAFTDINNHVEKLTDSLKEITSGVIGIEKAKQDTLGAIESISATSQETAAASEVLSDTAEKQLEEVNKLNGVVQQLKENASGLQEVVNVFKII